MFESFKSSGTSRRSRGLSSVMVSVTSCVKAPRAQSWHDGWETIRYLSLTVKNHFCPTWISEWSDGLGRMWPRGPCCFLSLTLVSLCLLCILLTTRTQCSLNQIILYFSFYLLCPIYSSITAKVNPSCPLFYNIFAANPWSISCSGCWSLFCCASAPLPSGVKLTFRPWQKDTGASFWHWTFRGRQLIEKCT